jgi:homocitrate synthase
MDDAKIAVETGVDGVDVVIGTSHFLREYSHGKSMAQITTSAIEVIEYVKSKGLEIRFSSEDSFRSDLVDLLSLYKAVDAVGVNRVGKYSLHLCQIDQHKLLMSYCSLCTFRIETANEM